MTYKATMGSISHGTLRTPDLLETFANELERLDHDKTHSALIERARSDWNNLDQMDSDGDEESSETVNELIDALNEFAPPFCFFGAHEGDGSDFGFWWIQEFVEGLPSISDPSEAESFGEECKFVNDHGNVTVYDSLGNVVLELV